MKRVERKKNPLPFQQAWVEHFVSDKYDAATTHWRKLADRVQRGVGNPCPLVLTGLPSSIVTFGEDPAVIAHLLEGGAVAYEAEKIYLLGGDPMRLAVMRVRLPRGHVCPIGFMTPRGPFSSSSSCKEFNEWVGAARLNNFVLFIGLSAVFTLSRSKIIHLPAAGRQSLCIPSFSRRIELTR